MSTPNSAFRALHDAHFNLVWSSLRRLGVREADVLDLAQKVFLTAYLKLPLFEGRSAVSTWLFGICKRVASDYRKSARLRHEVSVDASELDELTLGIADVSGRFEAHERTRIAESILAKLPEPQRRAFVMYELEELPARAIAQTLGISVGTVRSRIRLARQTFAREAERSGVARANGSKFAARDPERLLDKAGSSSSIVRHMLGLVRHVTPPPGAQEQAWRSLLARWPTSLEEELRA